MNITVSIVDYENELQSRDLVFLLDSYAQDPMGGGEPLQPYVKENLIFKLRKTPHAFSIIGYIDGKAAGLINCFYGFSTFSCKPLVNIHDVIVLKEFRSLGIGQKMLEKVEYIAKQTDCCKITLEVLESNHAAKEAYSKQGFSGYELDPAIGKALFWQKVL